jgi:hypothetical protein
MKSIDVFDETYTVDDSIKSKFFDGDQGMLETFGDDLRLALDINKETPLRVWTAVDGDDGELLLVNGLHTINRVYYLVTKENAKDNNEAYLILEAEQTEE